MAVTGLHNKLAETVISQKEGQTGNINNSQQTRGKKACKAYGVKAHNSTQVLPLSLLNISAFTIHLKLEEIIVTEKALPDEMGTEL